MLSPSIPSTVPSSVETREFAHIAQQVDALRATFESGKTRSYEWRSEQLGALLNLLQREEASIAQALATDLGKPRLESWMSEVNEVAGSVKFLRKNLKRWMKPERVKTPLPLQPGKSFIQREPLGVALIIAPWNYPLLLSLNPLAGAIAAGNVAVLKPSEVAPATSALLARLLPQYLDRDAVGVIEGGVPETTALLALRFDTIFYTGNGTVGRIVMQAAANRPQRSQRLGTSQTEQEHGGDIPQPPWIGSGERYPSRHEQQHEPAERHPRERTP